MSKSNCQRPFFRHFPTTSWGRGKPAPSFNHSYVQANLASELLQRLGSMHYVVAELSLELQGQQLVPDLAVLPRRPINWQRDTLWVREAPLATCEVLTLHQDVDSLVRRARFFLAAGVKSCWVIIPGISTVAVFTGPNAYRSFAHGSTDAVRDGQLGIEIPLLDLFG